ncbi:MAG: hypothetical protein WC109_02915 [Syntrophomonadaceae bacterium]|jgi:hypothetical protein|nr:hypothetical protein [Syntrophomonadaceae bacterium]
MDKLILKDLLVLKKSIYWALVYLFVILLVFSMTPPFDGFIYIMASYGATYIFKSKLFIDTGGFIALVNKRDQYHKLAASFYRSLLSLFRCSISSLYSCSRTR